VLLLVESGLVGVAMYLKPTLLNNDVLETAASQADSMSFRRRASSCSRAQYTYRDDARRHDSSQGVKVLMARNGLSCADVPLRNYSLTQVADIFHNKVTSGNVFQSKDAIA